MSVQRLASGTLAPSATETTIYTVPRHSRAVLSSLVMTNVSSSDAQITVRVSFGNSKFRVLPSNLFVKASDSFHLITPISIEANESLTLESDIPNAVEYYVSADLIPAIPTPTDRAE